MPQAHLSQSLVGWLYSRTHPSSSFQHPRDRMLMGVRHRASWCTSCITVAWGSDSSNLSSAGPKRWVVTCILCSPTEADVTDLCCTTTPKHWGSEQPTCMSCSCCLPVVKILLLQRVLTQGPWLPGSGDLKSSILSLTDLHLHVTQVTHISLAKQASELTESKEVGNRGSEEITIEILRSQKLLATIFLTWRNMLSFKDGNSK